MLTPVHGYARSISLALFAWLGATSAWGETLPDQTLDQVDAFDANVVLDMAFADPNAPDANVPDFADLTVNGGGGVAACKIAPRGLYCLATVTPLSGPSYQVVRFWEDPKAKPSVSQDLLRCDDTGLGLRPGVASPCIGLTVDLSGAIWVTGSKDGKSYSLIKVISSLTPALPSGCPGPNAGVDWTPVASGSNLCAREYAAGAGVLSDLNAIDGEEVAGASVWPFGYGILGLWNGVNGSGQPVSDAVFFSRDSLTPNPPRSFGPWGLTVGQRLLSTSLLQIRQTAPTPPLNYILATTNTGRIVARAATDPAPASGNSSVFDISGWEAVILGPTSINLGQDKWSACQALGSCTIGGTTLTATGGTFATKTAGTGAIGLGVNAASGGTAGEIDVNESVNVVFPSAHKVSAIQVLFLFNGPEYGDPAEKVRITVNGGPENYELSTRPGGTVIGGPNDDDTADWSGPGSVSKCGTTLNGGTGCFLITNPFPTAVTSLSFAAVDVNPVVGGNDSDFAIGRIETAQYGVRTSSTTGRTYLSNRDYSKVLGLRTTTGAPFQLELATSTKATNLPLALSTGTSFPDGLTVAPGISVDLTKDCGTPIDSNGGGGCSLVSAADGTSAAKFGAVALANNSTASGVKVFQVTDLPDCRYQPRLQDCYKLLNPAGPSVTDGVARAALIAAGWIVPVVGGSVGDNPAAERLNVTPLLPEDVTSQFDNTGVAPGGLPPLYISQRYRAQNEKQYKFDALFFKTEAGVFFTNTFGGEFDVFKLSGSALGCQPPTAASATIADRLKWDAVTTVSETYVSVGGKYIDTLVNVGCGTVKVTAGRTSLFPYDLEIAPDTYGPTIRKTPGGVTIVDLTPNNDGVFGRLVQSLYTELRTALDEYTCPTTTVPVAPLDTTTCNALRKYWDSGKQKLDACVDAAFQPKASASNQNCQSFRNQFDSYKAALPATTSGRPDLANRLGEQKWRWEVTKHVFETRFLPSIPEKKGFCRELYPAGTTACPNPNPPN